MTLPANPPRWIERRRGGAETARHGELVRETLRLMVIEAIERNTPMPNAAEIARVCGLTHPRHLARFVRQLRDAGVLTRLPVKRGAAPVFRLGDGRTTPCKPEEPS